jgi:hypothetical protein
MTDASEKKVRGREVGKVRKFEVAAFNEKIFQSRNHESWKTRKAY